MKKKVLVLFLIVCLLLSLVGVMVACGGGDGDSEQTGEDADGGTGESTSFDYQASVVNSKLDSLRSGSGYLIKYNIDASGENEASQISIGAKGNLYYVAENGYEYYCDVSNSDRIDIYEKSASSGTWEKTSQTFSALYTRAQALDAVKAYIGTYSLWMTYYQSFVASMDNVTKSSATVAGRSCDQFSFSAAGLVEGMTTVRANYSFCVDKSTSICLKWQYTYSIGGQSETWTMECTEFNTNPTFRLPTVADDTNNNNENEGNNQGNENQGAIDDQGGNQGNENQGGNQSGNTTVLTKTLETRDNIQSVIGDNYKIVARGLLDDGSITTVASDGVYFCVVDGLFDYFYKKIGENGNGTYLYPYSYLWNGSYHRIGTPTFTANGGAPTVLGRGTVGKIFQFDGEELTYNTEEAITFLGRPAKKYTFESDNAYGYNMYYHEEVIIDDATGACLRFEGSGRAGNGFTGSTRDKVNFEVTEFSYGEDNAAVSRYLDGYVAKIDVNEWEEEFIASVGLTNIAEPMGEVYESYWWDSDHNDRNSDYPYWCVEYRLYSDTQEEYQDYVESFLRSFYDGGVKLLYSDGEEMEYDDLFNDNGGDGDDLNVTGYIVGNSDYIVYVDAEYVAYSTPHYWKITVEIEKE